MESRSLAAARSPFDALPPVLLRSIMLALPVRARTICAAVCRCWRDFLSDPSLWQVLVLTCYDAEGVVCWHFPDLVRGAAARAAGQLRVFSFGNSQRSCTRELLNEIAEANAATLREVNVDDATLTCPRPRHSFNGVQSLRAFLAVVPHLQVLCCGSIHGSTAELAPVLRGDAPFGPVRVKCAKLYLDHTTREDALAAAAAASAHVWMTEMYVDSLPLNDAAVTEAVLNAACERRVTALTADVQGDFQADSPALARLLQCGSLEKLTMSTSGPVPAGARTVAVLATALQGCRSLYSFISLRKVNATVQEPFDALLNALAALPLLEVLTLSIAWLDAQKAAAGHALGALLAANPPSLRILSISLCNLGDDGLGPLLDGLASNTHLRTLYCDDNDPSDAFEHERLRPALRELAARE